MKDQQGFRIPEPSDRAIRWPERSSSDAVMAFYYRDSAAWLVPGNAYAYGSARELVMKYGNDWHQIVVVPATPVVSS